MLYRKTWLLFAALIALAALFAACGDDDDGGDSAATPTAEATPTPDSGVFPVTVTDSNGEEMTISAQPERIVALQPSYVEVLFVIGAGEAIVAADENTDYPPETETIPKISGFTPSVEGIASYNPDLVMLSFDPGGLQDALGQAGIASLFLGTPEDLDGVYGQIETIGVAAGYGEEATDLVADMQAEIDEIVAGVSGADSPTFFHEVDNTLYSIGPGSFLSDMYELLGATNVAAGTGQAFPQLNNEEIIAANPDVIVLADGDYGESFETVSARPGWDQITAVQSARVFIADEDLLSRPGPRIPEAMELLAGFLYR